MKEKLYMNINTGSLDTYEGWWYTNEEGQTVNAVDLKEVVEVELNENGEYIKVI